MELANLSAESFNTLGIIPAIFVAYAFGLLSSLTPCVYPLIPITLALFGASQEQGIKRRFSLAFVYVLGICLTYTTLGLISAKTGAIFGQFLGNPIVITSIAILLFFLGLVSLDVLRIDLINLRNKASKIGSTGFQGAFLMGAVSGLIAAPCVGPALLLMLSVAAVSKSVWGAVLLTSYSFGLGTIFLLISVFSGLLNKLPKSGDWLNLVKFLIASAVFSVALFFLKSILKHDVLAILELIPKYLNIGVIIFSLYAGYYYSKRSNKKFEVISSLLLAFSLSNILFLESKFTQSKKDIIWHESLEPALSEAQKNGKIVMLDLYADWCLACKELAEKTFTKPEVMKEFEMLNLARIDFTNFSDYSEIISKKYNIPGLPAVLFIKPDGSEISGTRVTGFVDSSEFVKVINKTK